MSCSSSFCSTSRLLSSAECDIFPWHLIHRTLLLILCTEFSCCVIWGQRLLQQPARQSAHPSTLFLPQRKGDGTRKWAKQETSFQTCPRCLANFWLLDLLRIYLQLTLSSLSEDPSSGFASNYKDSVNLRSTLFPPFSCIRFCPAALKLNQTFGQKGLLILP